MNIVAIGGGEMKSGETLPIDKMVVDLTGKKHPRALFIPTASGDAPEYCDSFDKIYGQRLGCRTDRLLLLRQTSDRDCIKEKIGQADIIYVGGGNTLRMMKLWRRLGVDDLLYRAGRKGTVLAGLSAGAICWHAFGHSDSRKFSGREGWPFIRVRGLGICPYTFCPHLDAEERHFPFIDLILRHGDTGIACDNNAAVWYGGGRPVVKSSRKRSAAYLYARENGNVRVEKYLDGEEIDVD